MEIWNYGSLPEGFTNEKLFGIHSSQPRNRNVADTMFKAGFIDTWGRGYKKIHDGFKAVGLPMPSVESSEGGVRISFHRGFDVIQGKPFDGVTGIGQTGGQTGGQTSDPKTIELVFELIKKNVIR